MKALVCHKYGPIDTMRVRSWPDPQPQRGEVLIDIAYVGVNFPDTLIVQGLYQVKPVVPFVPGHECSGIVRQVGIGVTHLKVGDRVMLSAGTMPAMAEKICVNQYRARKVPDQIPLDIAATIGVAYGTALHALKDMAQLQENETVLVLGASGGTGSAAVEVARAMGATVIAAASTDAKLDHCRRLGAEHTVNYDTEDLRARIEQIALNGVDVVFDPVGDRYAEPALRSLGFRGRYLVVGFAAGEIPRLPINLALLKERSIIGVYNGVWGKMRTQEVLTNSNILINWVRSQKLAPVITSRYSLDQAVDALQEAASRRVMGKIVLEVNTNLK